MGRATRWSRVVIVAALPLLMLGTALPSAGPVNAERCVEMPQLAAPAVQSQERWRYIGEGVGSYELVGWNPSEATLAVNSPGCLISTIGLVNLDLRSGTERWRVTSNQWDGSAGTAAADEGLIVLPTHTMVYAYDDSTGQELWSYRHTYEGSFPDIAAIENNIVVLLNSDGLTGIDAGTGTMVWQQTLPMNFIFDWENIEGGPLVVLGRPETGVFDIPLIGIDKSTGELIWQTHVGQLGVNRSGVLELVDIGSGLIAAEIRTGPIRALTALDGATGAIAWTAPLIHANTDSSMHITKGAQSVVVFASGDSRETRLAIGYNAATGEVRWKNRNIGADAVLADDTHLVGAGPTLSKLDALVLVDGETGEIAWSQQEALVDDGFANSAQVVLGELVFTPSLPKEAAPTIFAIDLVAGTVNWSSSYPEFARLDIIGTAAGIVLATGITADEAVLIGLAS